MVTVTDGASHPETQLYLFVPPQYCFPLVRTLIWVYSFRASVSEAGVTAIVEWKSSCLILSVSSTEFLQRKELL